MYRLDHGLQIHWQGQHLLCSLFLSHLDWFVLDLRCHRDYVWTYLPNNAWSSDLVMRCWCRIFVTKLGGRLNLNQLNWYNFYWCLGDSHSGKLLMHGLLDHILCDTEFEDVRIAESMSQIITWVNLNTLIICSAFKSIVSLDKLKC